MRMRRCAGSIMLAGLLAGSSAAAKEITTASLLAEMTDLGALAEFPDPPYTCKQFSSYDRSSQTPSDFQAWFANNDRGQYLRVEHSAGHNEYVMMDADGPGAIVGIWSANPEGTLRIYLDGNETPALQAPMMELLGGKTAGIPAPIACELSKGWTSYFPIAYARHCKVTADRDDLYYHVDYRTYPADTKVATFRGADLKTLATTVKQIAQRLASPRDGAPPPGVRVPDAFWLTVEPGQTRLLKEFKGGRAICEFFVKVKAKDILDALRKVVLTMEFDGEKNVECPIGDFFGAGPGVNAYESLPLGVTADGEMWCHWYMPFEKSASISFRNFGTGPVTINGGLSTVAHVWTPRSMHFHAKWRTEFDSPTRPMRDWNYLQAAGKGVFAGVAFAIGNPVTAWWGEGDEKIYVDGEAFPSYFGTGTEDYYGYAWCCEMPFWHAYHNQPRCDGVGNYGQAAHNRWHIMDRIPFTKRFQFDMELWDWADGISVTMSVVPYWYALPGATDGFGPIRPADLRLQLVKPWPSQKVAGAIEGEAMRVIEHTAQITQHVVDQSSDGKVLFWCNGTNPGDKLVLAFPANKTGKYRVFARFFKSDDSGIVQMSINGQRAGVAIDLYNDRPTAAPETDLGVFDLPESENRIVVEMVGANNKAAREYLFGLDYLRVVPAQ
jgi:hypothetical protein